MYNFVKLITVYRDELTSSYKTREAFFMQRSLKISLLDLIREIKSYAGTEGEARGFLLQPD